jgi:hypothetical protein
LYSQTFCPPRTLIEYLGPTAEAELEGDLDWLKLSVRPLDRGNEHPPDPLCAGLESRGEGVVSFRSARRLPALAGPLASIHKGIA